MDNPSQLDELLSKHKVPLAIGFVGLVLLIGGVISSGLIPKTFVKSSKSPTTLVQTSSYSLKVDVSGAVLNPGVYTLSLDSRVEDAIKAAGGVREDVDPNFVSKTLNLAQKVSDGMKIYVPTANEQVGLTAVAGAGTSSNQSNLINVNSATAAELDKLPGVGPVSAQNIIDKRPYAGIEELFTKKAVNRSVYEKIKGLVSTY